MPVKSGYYLPDKNVVERDEDEPIVEAHLKYQSL